MGQTNVKSLCDRSAYSSGRSKTGWRPTLGKRKERPCKKIEAEAKTATSNEQDLPLSQVVRKRDVFEHTLDDGCGLECGGGTLNSSDHGDWGSRNRKK